MQSTPPGNGPQRHADSIPPLAPSQQISEDIDRINRVAGDLMLRFIGHGLVGAEQMIEMIDKKKVDDDSKKSPDL